MTIHIQITPEWFFQDIGKIETSECFANLFVCKQCGALVAERGLHLEWHTKNKVEEAQ